MKQKEVAQSLYNIYQATSDVELKKMISIEAELIGVLAEFNLEIRINEPEWCYKNGIK